MTEALYQNHLQLLHRELIPALGCTEPITIALAAARARQLLGEAPVAAQVYCSGNLIKNVKSVLVPNSGGRKGIEIAAALGIVGGNPQRDLEVLEEITTAQQEEAARMVADGAIVCRVAENVDNLYVSVELQGAAHSTQAVIAARHTNFVKLVRDGETLLEERPCADANDQAPQEGGPRKDLLTVGNILEFARTVKLEEVKEVLDRQIQMNNAIADYGMEHHCGHQVGRMMLDLCGNTTRSRAMARAAAASDARMNGCTLPVVINSGSGNQGITVSLPVIEYARGLNASRETLYRALVISNLVSIHQKYFIGSLSAYCGAVSAASGAGAAITYLYGGTPEQIAATIVNTLANVSGVICDGAKSSCAAKIASAVGAAILADAMSRHGEVFQPGDGIVQKDVETTMKSVGHLGRYGMAGTDSTIVRLMTGEIPL